MTPDELRDAIPHLESDAIVQMAANAALGSKPWWTSRTIWGAIVVIVAQIGLMFGVAIDTNAMIESALAIATLIGAIVAWWGRVNAGRPISLTRILPGIKLLR